ncbi:MAG TPA: PDZ domain-containing protein [Cryptosporangiaceae bacterium]|nr:PDZ domain-containing protein [Cryptosporangiaceae bacterium]
MMRRGWTVLVGAVLVLGLSIVLSVLPVPYVALRPGPTVDTLGKVDGKEVITITGRPTSQSKGRLNLTTVSVSSDLDLGTAVRFWLDGTIAVVPREVVYPPGQTEKQVDQDNAAAFKKSQTSAETSALRELGYPVAVTVSGVPTGSPSSGKLTNGDVVTTVDGAPVSSALGLRKLLAEKKPGDAVTVGYTRAGKPATVVVTLGEGDADAQGGKRAVLGVEVENSQPHPFTVDIDLDRIGGPSAGLMFALAIIDKVEPADLTGGVFIAGSGEIDDDGVVGPIGGIPQKMVAAREAGATVFLTPADNCAEAVGVVPEGLRLARVATLDDALAALSALRTGGTPVSCPR